ncbi:MAG: methyltransferase domain-containing protein [Opitutae bacterium]|nr:methyltransferase domain-containing protein [Opitutae bacterium]
MIADSSHALTGQIRTDFVSFPNRAGLKIAACLDYAGDLRGRPWIVVAPKYGETKKNNLQIAYFLAANGLNVLRFDHTNHVGESAGDQIFFTLAGGSEDILSCGDYLQETYSVGSYTLMANSLSARTAIRAAARDTRTIHLVCLVGVVNVGYTLNQVYREDLVGGHLAGKRWGVTDILGVDIDFDSFLGSAVREKMHDLDSTRMDLDRTKARISFFPAERDTWVSLTEVQSLLEANPNAGCFPIPGAMHELRENPVVAQQAFNDVVAACVGEAYGVAREAVKLQQPDKRVLMQQNRAERDRLRESVRTPQNETEFWSAYLKKYQTAWKIEDYQAYLAVVGRMLGEIKPGEVVLDAGCGNGMFGLWVLRALLEAARITESPPIYVGVDLTADGLSEAMATQLSYSFSHGFPPGQRLQDRLALLFGQMDIDTWGLPEPDRAAELQFADGTFNKVCLSLVLSYLNRPERVLAELYRVLRPGGRIVVSSMKPFCDMSEIYRDYMDQQVTDKELTAGRNLLSAASQIRLKEEQGIYTFYAADELTALLEGAGFVHCFAQQSFGGQAVVVVAER